MSYICQIELSVPKILGDDEISFLVIGRFKFDPGLGVGDELNITDWEYRGRIYKLETKVTGIKKEICPSPYRFSDEDKVKFNINGYSESNGLFLVRYFVEASDRETIIEIAKIGRGS